MTTHVHTPRLTEVKNIVEMCECGWWRWHPDLKGMFLGMPVSGEWHPEEAMPKETA